MSLEGKMEETNRNVDQGNEEREMSGESNRGEGGGAEGIQAPPHYVQHQMPHAAVGYHMMSPEWMQMVPNMHEQAYAFHHAYG